MTKTDVVIIGGGAAGLMASISAARGGAKVIIIEHMEKTGKKILATGNGKCNYTNALQGSSYYRGENPAFVLPILKQFDRDQTIRFFDGIGIYPKQKNGCYYPKSGQASSVLQALNMEAGACGVSVRTSCQITSIKKQNDSFLITAGNETLRAGSIIFATGLYASPKTGSDGSALPYIEQFGHKIIDIVPALVPLKGKQSFFKEIAGIRAEIALSLYIDQQKTAEEKGELQLTEYGISGIVIFQISRYAAKALQQKKQVHVTINFLPELENREEICRLLEHRFLSASQNNRRKSAKETLIGLFPDKLIPVLLKESHIKTDLPASSIKKQQTKILAETISSFRVDITDTRGFEQAQVCAGGVSTAEIDNQTLESKLVPGLFFAGEVIDIDGACGGYNLQWAWSSGYVAGVSACRCKQSDALRIRQLIMPIHHTEKQLEEKIKKVLKLSKTQKISLEIIKKSLDARKKPDLKYSYTVDVSFPGAQKLSQKLSDKNIMPVSQKHYSIQITDTSGKSEQTVIVGTGPAGLFCAYALLKNGIRPILIERGKRVEERIKDIETFWQNGTLDTNSNVQFGEGGAGTFSDGKLNTLVKDPLGRNRFVLETFVKFGAPQSILYENKPHIGTDILAAVVKNMRTAMESGGAEFLFSTCMTDYRTKDKKLSAVELDHRDWLTASEMVLAIGHSSRDTFRMLAAKRELPMEAKAFAVGYRVEHPQMSVNFGQYGERYFKELPAASYKLAASFKNGRSVYSFCMCPGGYVVNASSEQNRLVINGMSYAARDAKNANSAIIVSVSPVDFDEKDVLSGVRFQEQLEERAYALCAGKIPQQLFGDYMGNRPSVSYGAFESQTKGAASLCNLRGLLPPVLEQTFIDGMHQFAHEVHDFDRSDAIISGIESRTSSPLRIRRKDNFMSDIDGIYPCGEGAGYAGGIMSAAMDGLKTAEAIIKNRKS